MSRLRRTLDEPHRRVSAAMAEIYPRLLVHAARVRLASQIDRLEPQDLCQEGALAAVQFVYGFSAARLSLLSDDALQAVLYAVAARAIHGRLVDRLRRNAYRRGRGHLAASHTEWDAGSQAQPEACAALAMFVGKQTGACRRVLDSALEVGELDVPEICARSGLSRAYVYRVLQALAAEAGRTR